jgi:hypothetical protein
MKGCVVEGGTHIMILNKYRWFNTNLPDIILKEDVVVEDCYGSGVL